MRSYGEYADVSFQRVGWSIYNLAYEYRIWDGYDAKSVFVTSMRELKDEINKFVMGGYDEENEI